MAKLPLSTVGSIQNQPTTATSTLNANFSDITTALENTLSRNGASPNSMGSTLDMDSNPIINLPMPVNGTEPVRKIDLDALLTSLLIEGDVIFSGPPGAVVTNASGIISSTAGSNGQILRSNGPGVAPSFGNFTDLLTGLSTGTGLFVLQTSPTLITPALGTPSSGTLTNCTGLPIGALTGLGANVSTFLITPSSANLINAVTDETGTGALVFASSPTLITPNASTSLSLTGAAAPSLRFMPTSGATRNHQLFQSADVLYLYGDGLGARYSFDLISPNIYVYSADASGYMALSFPSIAAGGRTLTFPVITDTLVGRTTTDTLTNKTLTTPAVTTNLTIGGVAFPALIFSPSSGATVTGQVLQGGDSVHIYNGSVGTRYSFDLANADIYVFSPAATGYLNLHFPGITNGAAASLTFPYANDTLVARDTTDTLTNKSLTSPALTGVPTTPTAAYGTNTTQVASTAFVQAALAGFGGGGSIGPDLTAIEALASTGFAARTAADTWALRTITGTAAEITVTNGSGAAGNPTLSLPSAMTFTGKTVTGGLFSGPSLTTPAIVGSATPSIQFVPSSGATLSGQIYQQGDTLALATTGVGNRVEVGLGANSGINAFDTLNITPANASGSLGINITNNGVTTGAQATGSNSYSFNVISIPQEAARVTGSAQYVNGLQVRMISGGTNKIGSRAAGWFETYVNSAPKTDGVLTGTINTGGAGYTNGTTTNVQLQRASDNAFVNTYATVTVAGGAVTSVFITDPGTGRTVGQVLTSNGGVIGGSGFQYTVTALTDAGDDVGLVAQAKALANVGGTGVTNATARGTLFSLAPLVILESGATNWWSIGCGELDVTISGGASAAHRYGWDIVSSGGSQGAVTDSALHIRGSSTGWKTGINFGSFDIGAGGLPVDASTGTLIGTDSFSYNAANCIKLQNWTFSGDIFHFNNFRVTGAGVMTATSQTGTTTNNDAAAGMIGEYVESSIGSGSAVSLSSDVWANVTTLSLTAGDWDVEGYVTFNAGSSTLVYRLFGSISTVSANPGTHINQIGFPSSGQTVDINGKHSITLTRRRISLGSAATVYLVGTGGFTTSTLAVWGHINARRVR